jgi:hypothetical protein
MSYQKKKITARIELRLQKGSMYYYELNQNLEHYVCITITHITWLYYYIKNQIFGIQVTDIILKLLNSVFQCLHLHFQK